MCMKPRLGFDILWRVVGVGVGYVWTEKWIERETLRRECRDIQTFKTRTKKKQILKRRRKRSWKSGQEERGRHLQEKEGAVRLGLSGGRRRKVMMEIESLNMRRYSCEGS